MRNFIKPFIISTSIAISVYAQSYNIDELRQQKQVELDQHLDKYRKKAQEYKQDGTYDSKKDELLDSYSKEKSKIDDKYKDIDSKRREMVDKTLQANKGKVDNTGSVPKNVDADVDYVANDNDGYESVREDWNKRGDKVDDKGYRLENKNTDEVIWKPDSDLTPEQKRAKNNDPDSYITTGGKKSTGVRGADVKSSDSGAGLDPMRKLTTGIKDGNTKDVGKSLIKVTTQADGVDVVTRNDKGKLVIQKELDSKAIKENELLNKAKKLKDYKDPVEAGIVDLADSPEVAKKKVDDFNQDALDLAAKKQEKLDIANKRKERLSEALIESLPEGSETRKNVEKRLKDSRESNELARKQVNDSIEKSGYENNVKSQDEIAKIEEADYKRREVERQKDKKKTLENAKKRKASDAAKKKKSTKSKKVKVSGMGAASFAVSAYQFEESAEGIIEAGGNDFVTINKDDSQLEKNLKAYTGAAIESTTFGGAFSAGKRADEEEKKRIQDAIRKGKTVNPIVSWARASFWGLYYVAKDNVTGAIEYTKDKLVKLDKEIKDSISESVDRKYEAKKREAAQKLLEKKRKEYEARKKKELEQKKEVKKKKVVFFQDNDVNSELSFMKQVDKDKARQERADDLVVRQENAEHSRQVAAGRQAFAEGMQSLATGLAAAKTQIDANNRAYEQKIKAHNAQTQRTVNEMVAKNNAYKNNPNNPLRQVEQQVMNQTTGYTSNTKINRVNYSNTNSYKPKPKPVFVPNKPQPQPQPVKKQPSAQQFYLVFTNSSMMPKATQTRPKTYISKTGFVCAWGPFRKSEIQRALGGTTFFNQLPSPNSDGYYTPKKSCLKRP